MPCPRPITTAIRTHQRPGTFVIPMDLTPVTHSGYTRGQQWRVYVGHCYYVYAQPLSQLQLQLMPRIEWTRRATGHRHGCSGRMHAPACMSHACMMAFAGRLLQRVARTTKFKGAGPARRAHTAGCIFCFSGNIST